MIVLDTYAWIWASTEPSKLSEQAARSLEYSKTAGFVPDQYLGRFLPMRSLGHPRLRSIRMEIWLAHMLAQPRLKVLDLLPRIALLARTARSRGFPGIGRPNDRRYGDSTAWPLVTWAAIRDFWSRGDLVAKS